MKAKDIVVKITQSLEYCRLVRFWTSWNDKAKELPPEIVKTVHALDKKIDEEKKSFLCSFGLKSHPNIIEFKVPRQVQDAKDDFDRELNQQMPVFIQLMDSTPIESLIRESIAM